MHTPGTFNITSESSVVLKRCLAIKLEIQYLHTLSSSINTDITMTIWPESHAVMIRIENECTVWDSGRARALDMELELSAKLPVSEI